MADNRINIKVRPGNGTILLILSMLYLLIYFFYYENVFKLAGANPQALKMYDMKQETFERHREKVKWLLIFFSIAIIFIRMSFASVFLLAGTYLSTRVKIGYKKIARTVLLAEFIFVFRDLVGVIVGIVSKNPEEPAFDTTLSLYSFVTDLLVDYPLLAFPSRSLNLYLLVYIFIIALIIRQQNLSFRSSINFTFKYFGLGYFIWTTLTFTFSLYAASLT